MQVFGKDSVLNLGARETAESREQWLEDVDMEVSGISNMVNCLPQTFPSAAGSDHGAQLLQEAPSTAERFKDKYAQNKNTPIKGVRMGAGERSYLVRNDQIDVLKNVYGGVQVSQRA